MIFTYFLILFSYFVLLYLRLRTLYRVPGLWVIRAIYTRIWCAWDYGAVRDVFAHYKSCISRLLVRSVLPPP